LIGGSFADSAGSTGNKSCFHGIETSLFLLKCV
jgi:hypothetical protein